MRKNRTLFFLLAGMICVTLVTLFLLSGKGEILGMDDDDFARLSYLSIFALLLASAFTFRGAKLSKISRDVGIWVALLLVLLLGYAVKDDFIPLWERTAAALIPGSPANIGDGRVQIARAQSGSFVVKASVNKATVDFIFDTGANAVVLTYDDAKRSGFRPERLTFNIPVDTANGQTTAAPIIIKRIEIGSIFRHDVRGLIARQNDLHTSLLGMTFVDRLGSFNVRGDTLELVDKSYD